jgi:hypothetical protein
MKFKELLLREEPRQGGLVARLWSVLGALSVRFRFVFGASSRLSRVPGGSFPFASAAKQ